MSIADTPLADLELSAPAIGHCAQLGVTTLAGVLMLDADSGLSKNLWKEIEAFQNNVHETYNAKKAADALEYIYRVMDLHPNVALIFHDGRTHLIGFSSEEGGQDVH